MSYIDDFINGKHVLLATISCVDDYSNNIIYAVEQHEVTRNHT